MLDTPFRVLVADDCPDNRQAVALLLAAWGFDARTAADGPSALEEFRSFRPDAVVLETRLSGLDGWEVARRIREEAGDRAVLLVAPIRPAEFPAPVTKAAGGGRWCLRRSR